MKALILTAYFPPSTKVGASRVAGWVRHFPAFEIDTYVIRPAVPEGAASEKNGPGESTVLAVKIPSTFLSKMLIGQPPVWLRWFGPLMRVMSYAMTSWNPYFPFYIKGLELIRSDGIDVILATGEPFHLFAIAAKLSKKTGIPWIADYRDAWSGNYDVDFYSYPRKWFTRHVMGRIEKGVVRSASLITTVSLPLTQLFEKKFPEIPVHCHMNGYDAGIMPSSALPRKNQGMLTFAYAGTIYPYQRSDIFFETLIKAREKGLLTEFCVEMYGLDDNSRDLVRKYENALQGHMVFVPRLDGSELMQQLSRVDVLLVFANAGIDGSCTKIYEYLALSRRILCVINDHSTLELLVKKFNAGHCCENADDLMEIIIKLSDELKKDGQIKQERANFDLFEKRVLIGEFSSELIRRFNGND